ncbi:M16 family metallopeptidase [Pseudoalteromonas caenipelagi]|uniref:M16 family metallopeptidase n=1 Tax=Pseudoalteromonas caenipelagi TaxID=2726988 RepID=UPI001FE2F099|nr:insulinase family protein [Pseudoalteromonas caenipelagi]
MGSDDSLTKITIEDLKAYHKQNIAPQLAKLYVAGAVKHNQIKQSLAQLTRDWQSTSSTLPALPEPTKPSSAQVYFYDIPGAKQSTLLIGQPSLKANDPNYFKAGVMNYMLGGGGFASRLTQEVRANKGYTYGIRSKFNASSRSSLFEIKTNVRSNVTVESLMLTKDIVEQYANTFSQADLATTKSYYKKSNARRFETLGAKMNLLEQIGALNLPHNFIQQQSEQLESLTVKEIQTLAQQHIIPNRLIYIVVGDAKTQAKRLDKLGLGEVVMLN